MTSGAMARIVVVGGGFAGVEAAFTLRGALGERAAITVVSADTSFTMRPDTVYVAFGAAPSELQIPLVDPLVHRGIPLIAARVDDIDPASHVLLAHGVEVPYDYAILATGAEADVDRVPGLRRHAAVLWSPASVRDIHERFVAIRDQARRGEHRRVLFVVPAHNDWPVPLYELVLMFDSWLRRERVRQAVTVSLATCERGCLRAFGTRAEALLRRELEARAIEAWEHAVLEEVGPSVARFGEAGSLPFDLCVAAAPYRSSADFHALARDSRGFVLVDQGSRQALGCEDVFVVGDAADFPVKQAVLALLQADAAAEAVVARIEGRAPRFVFAPTSVLLLDELDTAMFAQVPLQVTDTPGMPLRVVEAQGRYVLGSSPAWRLGRKAMSHYLTWRLRSGRPFQGGFVWRGLQQGLEWMERAFAD